MARGRGWHSEDIKAAIRKRGQSLKSLALANGLCESACRASLLRPQPASDRVISKFLGVPLHRLWPDRYLAGGQRRPVRHVRDEGKRNFDRPQRQIAGAR